MSFSYTVKEEIIQSNSGKSEYEAMLLGMLMYSKSFSCEQILLQTENDKAAECFSLLLGQVLKDTDAVTIQTVSRNKRSPLYLISIDKAQDREAVIDYFKLNPHSNNGYFPLKSVVKKKHFGAFTAGAFLSCGSVSDPLKEYHLEFVIPDLMLCNTLGEVFLELGITAKQTERKKSYVVYLKESENIEDALTFMGAPKSSLEIMNVKILKNVRNKINRAVNCDSANIEKTIKASEKQIEAIEKIEKNSGLDSLPDDLIEIAQLRRENPDWSLKELGASLSEPISRSGANHRMNRILTLAFGEKH